MLGPFAIACSSREVDPAVVVPAAEVPAVVEPTVEEPDATLTPEPVEVTIIRVWGAQVGDGQLNHQHD